MSLRAFYLRNKFWFNDWKNGSPIRSQYDEIKFIAEHSFDEGFALREKALHKLLSFAQQNTSFYSAYNSMKLEDYPVMNKLAIIANHDKIAVNPECIPGQKGDAG